MAQGKCSSVEVDRMRQAILDEANIVCSTLAFAGSGVFRGMKRPFDVVVVDEAAQAVEPSSLVPMRLGAKQVRDGCRAASPTPAANPTGSTHTLQPYSHTPQRPRVPLEHMTPAMTPVCVRGSAVVSLESNSGFDENITQSH